MTSPYTLGLDIQSTSVRELNLVPQYSLELKLETGTVPLSLSFGRGPRGLAGEDATWVQVTQSEYDALNPPNPNTLYIIVN